MQLHEKAYYDNKQTKNVYIKEKHVLGEARYFMNEHKNTVNPVTFATSKIGRMN